MEADLIKWNGEFSFHADWFCTGLFISPLLFTETPTCLLQHLGRPSVSSCPHGLDSCLTRVDVAIKSCPLHSLTARTSRALSVPSGLNMCWLWSPLPVSTALHIHINSWWSLNVEIGRLQWGFFLTSHKCWFYALVNLLPAKLSCGTSVGDTGGIQTPTQDPKSLPDTSFFLTPSKPKSEKDAYS